MGTRRTRITPMFCWLTPPGLYRQQWDIAVRIHHDTIYGTHRIHSDTLSIIHRTPGEKIEIKSPAKMVGDYFAYFQF